MTDTEARPRIQGGFLPEPERRPRRFPIVSVDDHLVEPPELFEGRLPRRFVDRQPRVVETDDGGEAWLFEDQLLPNVGLNAVAGKERVDGDADGPMRFSDMRRGAWSIKDRIHDMDIDGVYASLCFPSFLSGFGGVRLQTLSPDRDLSHALVRAWNDWCIDEWAGGAPDRIIPCQLPWLHDPEVGAAEIRSNAERGFKAVSFPELPFRAELPSLHSTYWDPFVAACEETETVVCVHTGSSGVLPEGDPAAPLDVMGALFGAGYSLGTVVDWLFSGILLRFPRLKLVIAEGGIGWVPSLLDRLDHNYSRPGELTIRWRHDLKPAEVLQRNFWFCLLNEPSAMVQRERIGVDRILFECDYPHSDSSWPDTQALAAAHFDGLPVDDVERMTWRNAAELFRHPIPQSVIDDPNSF